MRAIRRYYCCCTRSFEKIVDYVGMSKLINEYSTVVIDVRSQQEFKEGHINGAINIPLYRIKNDCTNVITDRNKYIVVYCTSGIRSQKAQIILNSLGYNNVYNLKCGYIQ